MVKLLALAERGLEGIMKKKPLVIALVLYVISAAVSFAVFSAVSGPSTANIDTQVPGETADGQTALGLLLQIDPNAPRNQQCPLNGQMYTDAERQAWEKRRPLAVMIENTPDARPQSGMSDADVVFEAVAEGGITRFLGLFYCAVQVQDTTLAPIRSARTYYVDWASGFNLPMYVHVGGANVPGPTDALGQIGQYGWNGQNDINQFSVGYPTFVRDYNRVPGKDIATEHTMVTSTEKLWEVATDRGWTNMSPTRQVGRQTVPGTDWKAGFESWAFSDGNPGAGSVNTISYDFFGEYPDYAVTWMYDPATNSYKRTQGGEAHTDLNDGAQVTAKNVVILFTEEEGPLNEKKHMLYGTTGTGDVLIFQNGQVIEGTWSKPTRESELVFKDAKGQPVQMVRGLTWISVLADGAEVQY